MADDPSKSGQADRLRINVNQQHELDYWTKKWSITPTQLKAAVKIVGPMVADVQKYLKK